MLYVHAPGNVLFRELLYEPEFSHLLNARVVSSDATVALYSTARGVQEQRIERAAVQYEIALRRYHAWERPLAIAHLYMGVEALTKAMLRYECARLGKTEVEYAADHAIAADDDKIGHKLEVIIRRDVIFQGDAATYDAIRKASDGLEHGFADWETIWSVPEDILPKAARLLREAILRAYGLPDEVYQRLIREPFDAYVEQGLPIAFEATAPISDIDLRARDFRIADPQRVLKHAAFNAERGEYSFEYRLEAPQNDEGPTHEPA